MPDAVALPLALLALAGTLAVAVLRPLRVPEAAAALAGALVLIGLGAISLSRAGSTIRQLAPTVGFLAALLLIAEGCRRDGVFDAIGDAIARRAGRNPRLLLGLVFGAASAVTIVLGLDATVVLLPPVVLVVASRLRSDPKRPLYACAHLANSASLLLPVSNLTNLLAFRASGLSFAHFALLMALPTGGVLAIEWAVLSRWRASPSPVRSPPGARRAPTPERLSGQPLAAPRYAVGVLGLTLVGFALSSALNVAPVWFAAAGAALINLPALRAPSAAARQLLRAAEPGFLIFVLGLGVIVTAAGQHGLSSAVRALFPAGGSLGDLLLISAISAALANLVNNLPATLILVPVAAVLGTGPVLAVLVGVNVGPNLASVGSLATLLWRRVLEADGVRYEPLEFVRLGLATVPAGLAVATTLLWVALQLF